MTEIKKESNYACPFCGNDNIKELVIGKHMLNSSISKFNCMKCKTYGFSPLPVGSIVDAFIVAKKAKDSKENE